ncbi:MAG: hypothetical protein ACLFTZ_01790 [Acholeplasmataceae bacterium]
MKALMNMERIHMSNELVLSLLSLYESKGKSFYYDDLFAPDRQAYERKALEKNIVALGHLFSESITDARIHLLAKRDLVAKNRDEQRLKNIKSALMQLHRNPTLFELIPNEVGNLANVLGNKIETIQYVTEPTKEKGVLKTKKRHTRRDDLEELMALFSKNRRSRTFELTQLITNFYVDFLNMKIMTKENELIGIIVLYALVLRDFSVFKYVPFFRYFMKKKDDWDHAVIQANYYWSSGYAQTDLLSRMLIDLLIEAYRDVDQMAHEYAFEKDLNKTDNVENSIMKLPELFTKEDLRKRHPNVSDATIDRTLRRLREKDIIRPVGRGRSARWQRIVSMDKGYQRPELPLFDE